MVAAEHVLRCYLAGTTDFTIVNKQGGFKLKTFSDSNWANNPDAANQRRVTSCRYQELQ